MSAALKSTVPFDAWLRTAVRGLGLSPAEAWAMSVRDFLALTDAAQSPMDAAALDALCAAFPDTPTDGGSRGS